MVENGLHWVMDVTFRDDQCRIRTDHARDQLELDLSEPAERRQRLADRRHWERRLQDLEGELVAEPKRVAESYPVRAQRLEPVGIVYLWPRQS
jgi:hypothetical protein